MVDLFRALGNDNRRRMIKILLQKKTHISGIARELGISVPVALKHAKVLEDVGIVERRRVGKSHVLGVRKDAIEKLNMLSPLFEGTFNLRVERGTSMLDALRKVAGITVQNRKDGVYITAVDGKKGLYVYEVDGKLPTVPADRFKIGKKTSVELKKLVPVIGKRIVIEVG